MSGFFHVTVPVIDIVHLPIPFQFVNCPNDEVSIGPAYDTSFILWFYFDEPVYCLLNGDQQNFPLNLKKICGCWVDISTHTNFCLLPTPPPVDVYFSSSSSLPPIPSPTLLEPAKIIFSPNYGECDNN